MLGRETLESPGSLGLGSSSRTTSGERDGQGGRVAIPRQARGFLRARDAGVRPPRCRCAPTASAQPSPSPLNRRSTPAFNEDRDGLRDALHGRQPGAASTSRLPRAQRSTSTARGHARARSPPSVSLNQGQGFAIVATSGATTATYYVRCLPADFPSWTFDRSGTPQVEWFTAAPFTGICPGISRNYVAFYDTERGAGVVDEGRPAAARLPSCLQRQRRLGTLHEPERRGTQAGRHARAHDHRGRRGHRERRARAPAAAERQLPLERRANADPGSSFCGLSNQKIADQGFQEVTPGGTVVKQWFASDHVPMTEIPASWCSTIVNGPFSGRCLRRLSRQLGRAGREATSSCPTGISTPPTG